MSEKLKYVFVFLLFALGCNRPVYTLLELTNFNVMLIACSVLVILASVFVNGKVQFTKKAVQTYIIFTCFFCAVTFLQTITKGSIPLGTILQYFFIATFPFYLTSFFPDKNEILFILVRTAVFVVQLSLIFWIPTVVLFSMGIDVLNYIPTKMLFKDATVTFSTHAVLHNFRSSLTNQGAIPRNCGMFWEPGALAGILTMSFLYLNSIKSFLPKRKAFIYLVWLVVGILSSLSTTGLLLIPLLLLLYYSEQITIRSQRIKFFVGAIVLGIAFYQFYINYPLLNKKILDQMEAVNNKYKGYELTRLGTIIYMVQLLSKDFMLGVGMNADILDHELHKRFSLSYDYAFGNGMMDYLIKFGVVMFGLVCIFIYTNTKNLIKGATVLQRLLMFGILLLVLQGEVWLSSPFMFSFIYFGLNYQYLKVQYTTHFTSALPKPEPRPEPQFQPSFKPEAIYE